MDFSSQIIITLVNHGYEIQHQCYDENNNLIEDRTIVRDYTGEISDPMEAFTQILETVKKLDSLTLLQSIEVK